MKYQNHGFTPKDLPIYERVGDLVLIGTNHRADTKKQPRRLGRFLDEVLGSDHLIFEGDKKSIERIRESVRTNYEKMAISEFQGPIHSLEEGANFRELGEKYGLRKDLLGLYDILSAIPQFLGVAQSYGGFLECLSRYLDLKKQDCPGGDGIESDVTLRMVPEIMNNFLEHPGLILHVGLVYEWYLTRLRDHELLGPKTLEYSSALDGKKTEIVGADHVNYLARRLRGEDVEQPKEWGDFVKGLEPQYGNAIRMIERDIFPEPVQLE